VNIPDHALDEADRLRALRDQEVDLSRKEIWGRYAPQINEALTGQKKDTER